MIDIVEAAFDDFNINEVFPDKVRSLTAMEDRRMKGGVNGFYRLTLAEAFVDAVVDALGQASWSVVAEADAHFEFQFSVTRRAF